MAEFREEGGLDNFLSSNENVSNVECAVCLQTCVHPAELPCGHVFCYLCIKGIVNQGRRCAMCRQDIPVDYLDKPRLLNPVDIELTSQGFEDGHLWFYEGNNGWWQYDERTSLELESAYQKGERCCDLLIAGFLYVADFDGMLQYRKNDPSRRRRIKRDLATTTKKGIAGLKATKICNMISSNHLDVVSNEVIQNLPVPNSSLLNNLGGIRIFNSVANDSGQLVETIQNTEESRERSCRCSLSSCRPANLTYSNVAPQTESPVSCTRNLNLDNVIHDTLDWTVEQIESLNLELLNEYEALFRDVNSYAQLQDNLNQSSYRRTNNYMRRYLNLSIPSSDSYESDLNSTVGELDVSNLSNNVVNNSAFELSSEETNHINSELNGSETDRTLQSSTASSSSVPASRNRGMTRTKLGEILHNIH